MPALTKSSSEWENHPLASFLTMLSLVFLINLGLAFCLISDGRSAYISASVAVAGTVYAFLYFTRLTEFPLITLILSLLHLLVLLPMMIWGRYHLKTHTAGELIGGSSSGIILTIAEIMIIQNLW